MSHRQEGPKAPRKLDPHTVQIIVKLLRDIVMFVLGAYGFIHELQGSGAERPQILIMSAAMMGLPFIIRGDENRREVKSNDRSKEGDDG